MVKSPDQETLTRIYTNLWSQSNPCNQVGYEDELQQLLYFEILAAIGIPPAASVLDVGCGLGHLYAYLQKNGFKGRYIGLDVMPHLIEQARLCFPGAEFLVGDIITTEPEACDYVLASGAFDYRTPNSLERWQGAITRMFKLARCGIAWNGIAKLPPDRNDLWAQPLSFVIELCDSLSPYYSLRYDYDPPHFTAYLYKREHFLDSNLLGLIGHLYLHPERRQELQNAPLVCAKQFGLSLQQLNTIAPLWAR
jgi:SAM-dependent methyltransferase